MKRLITLIASLLVLGCGAALAQEYVPTPVTVSKEKVKLNGKIYLSHVVLERQTLYSISKAYGVTEEALYEANPSLRETGLQKNAILLIPFHENAAPESSVESTDQKQAETSSYTEHTVKWYEDIEDIARRYDVSVKDIMELNDLRSKKLSTRQVLKIPVKTVVPAPQPEAAEADDKPDEVETVEPENNENRVQAQEIEAPEVSDTDLLNLRSRDVVDFSLVLPLRATGNPSELNMDFYSGVLLALKDLEAEGLKVQAHVYDLTAGMPPVDALVKSDFVLGPVASRDLEAILQRVDGRVPVISPLDQKASSLSTFYRNFIQVPTAVDNQYDDLGQWVKEDAEDDDKIILITEKGAGSVTASVAIRSALARRELTYDILNYAIVEGRGIPAILTGTMTKEGTNRVVVASESEAFIGDVVRNLGIMLGKGYDIVMYAPSKVRTFDTIEGSAYHDASLHISTSYHADYSSDEVDRFIRAYRALFRTEPSQFAFQGYDTARYFIVRAARYGMAWPERLGHERSSGLHTDFLFDSDGNGNHHNVAVRRIVFKKDYSTVLQK
ncbi:MAG: LysM peptidoglycan-binding domain-containing protein [Bacteroidales bacterium]|nr:LysM peptidoglycan-binding domain-containing protein [Bacteroidales bacterium]